MFEGSIVALITPMSAHGEVDYPALAELIEFQIEGGTSAIVSVGTTGESATLNSQEHLAVIEATYKMVNGRIPVIAGTGSNSTSEAIELTREAKNLGVDACLLVVPYYNKPTQKGMYQHFSAIAQAVDIPQIVYNVPGRTVADMLPETVIALSALNNIVGVKEASGDNSRVAPLLDGTAQGFSVLSGEDPTIYDFMCEGGQGIISVTANVAPQLMQQMCDAFTDQNLDKAKAIHQQLTPLHKALFVEPNPIPVKYALHKMNKINVGLRLPLLWLDEPYHQLVDQALSQSGIVQ